jgi:hypothetical protein
MLSMKSRALENPSKQLGFLSAATALVLWFVLAYRNQFYPEVVTSGTWTITTEMVLLAMAGIFTVLAERPALMILVFLSSFFPVGLYLSGVPSIFRLIGISDLLFLLSSILILSRKVQLLKS